MAAKRTGTTKRATARKTAHKKTPRMSDSRSLDRLEKELPTNLARLVRQVRRSLNDMERQLEKARADGEKRWSKIETQARSDTARLLRKLENAVEPSKRTRKKATPRPQGSGEAAGEGKAQPRKAMEQD